MRSSAWLLAALLACSLLGCGPSGGAPPYAFQAVRAQPFRFESTEKIEIDDTPVQVDRVADLRLEGDPLEDARLDLTLFLDRYYMRVDGAPTSESGASELAISDKGIVTSGGRFGDQRLAPGEEKGLLHDFLEKPIGGCVMDSRGARLGSSWSSQNPLLQGVDVLEWVLLALPLMEPSEVWSGKRSLPRIGQYELGIDIPIRYERSSGAAGQGGNAHVQSSGFVRRARVEVANGLSGPVEIDLAGEATLDPRGRIVVTRADLLFRFTGEDGTRVSSRHRVELRCTECDTTVNPVDDPADTSSG